MYIIAMLFITNLLLAQDVITKSEYETFLNQNIQSNISTKTLQSISSSLKEMNNESKNLQKQINNLNFIKVNKQNNLNDLKTNLNKELSNLGFFKIKRKKAIRCYLDALNDKFPNFKECNSKYGDQIAKLQTSKELIKTLSKTNSQIDKEINSLTLSLNYLKTRIKTTKYIESEEVKKVNYSKNSKQVAIKDIDSLKNISNFSCNSKLETIDLENKIISNSSKIKGPFHNVPHDHQDGLNTCYANTARNLIIAASKGADNPSFLDLALQFKSISNDFDQGVGFGNTCDAIEAVKSKGYCEVKFSPTENGEDNKAINSLLPQKAMSVSEHSEMIDMMKDFINGSQTVSNNFERLFVETPNELIKKLSQNENLIFPLPLIDQTMANEYKTHELFYIKNPKNESLHEEFKADLINLDKKFKDQFVNLLLSKASKESIANAYSKGFKDVLDKYSMGSEYENIKKRYLKTFKKIDDTDLQKLKISYDFLNRQISNDLIDSNNIYCIEKKQTATDFLANLLPLAKYLNKNNINSSLLYQSSNGLKDKSELMQLIIAPSCLNSKNRKKLNESIVCQDKSDFVSLAKSNFKGKKVYDAFRLKLISKLSQGLAVGNSFSTGPNANHINTIVGLRYNPASQNCEYKIRESMDAQSHWINESSIVDKINTLTEIDHL